MDQARALDHLRGFFAARRSPEQLEHFETLRAIDLVQDSTEAVDLLFHLEEATGVELGLAEIGLAVASMTFGELAGELQRVVAAKKA